MFQLGKTIVSAINYDQWEICDDACVLVKELQVPVLQICKRSFNQQVWRRLVFGIGESG